LFPWSREAEVWVSKLEKLDAQVRSCRLCRLCRGRINGVPGDGNENTAVMFIGEGPGYNEDQEGKPFVGQAGKFLDELLAVAGLRRAEVYITNVVKCRPPQNRDPLPDEIDACSGYLERQIATIDPLLIVTLGRHSMARFFPDARITSIAGKAQEMEGRMVLPMLHPAYGLRDERGRAQLKEDFARLPDVLEQARTVRANRPGPPPPQQARLRAVVEAHLDTRPDLAPPVGGELVTGAVAAVAEDPFAYVAVVAAPPRKPARRKPAEVGERAPLTIVPVADAAEPVGVAEAAPVYEEAGPAAVEALAPPVADKPKRPRVAKPAAPEAPPAEAPAADKKKPGDFEQLSLFG
jgi:DNA polymerase